ncbi:ABC transporter ATP-binding protein [Clostridium tagluense]|uniref:ABC transporter ATP-binding protein n=1 Tax=Clostridium tagluense TaxID=360422 RepID=UPI001CF215CD|nr:ABC transporter ATP-binding protein [Clostridium tagluense]MCB2310367.1 ABC transporter ATP-binding protein [Clostridium tagluense]MCB2314991.1 ABC transporter ATP-binding protein [Clostridium tagluense]MCB2320068.1 ABC transporter ATP-binding protein [Clostridium tagluense]MCB2324734.1 ABC transporter ATP-binding protein [Clostridium tagluense]MCB2329812.1 ABC transporter ATP-binding protein [Clostridium tagluense]
MLELIDVNIYYGAIHALKGISLKVLEGEIVTLIGANGAGKTTALKTISGVLRPKSGKVLFKGNEIQKINAEKLVGLGISHVPEGRRVFMNMSIMENLEMGAYSRKDKSEIKKDYEKIFQTFPRLLERKNQMAGTLSGGEQQMLAIGRALMARPKLLLLDEPSMGLAPLMVKQIFSIIKDINEKGTTILLIEQNATMALKIADRGYVIQNGCIQMTGNAKELLNNDSIKTAYLGA